MQQASVDVWSIHYYNSSSSGSGDAMDAWGIHHYNPSTAEATASTCFFTDPCVDDMSVVTAADEAATEAGASLFVGEFGGPDPEFTGPSHDAQLWPEAVLQAQVDSANGSGSMIASAIWAWGCYTHRSDMNCIFPGSDRPAEAGSDTMVAVLQETNAELVEACQL